MQSSTTTSTRITVSIVFSVLLAATTSDAWAQQKLKYFFKAPPGVQKYVEQHGMEVGDVPGHQVRVAQLQAKYTDVAPEFNGVKVAESNLWLYSDYIDGSGRFVTYAVLRLVNGDSIFERSEALLLASASADGSKRSSYSQVTSITGGTGKFSAIRGTLKSTGATDFKTGTSDVVAEGEYWFEK